MKISIEDFCEDIVGKALRGKGLDKGELATRAGVKPAALDALLRGQGEESTARVVAPQLGLNADKLVEALRGEWYPQAREIEGLVLTNTPYHDMFVNAYLLWKPGERQAAIFDTGADASGLLRAAEEHQLEVTHVFLTHTHRDHIMDLDRVVGAFPRASLHVGEREQESVPQAAPVAPGASFEVGSLSVTARLTFGHSAGGVTYVVKGLEVPLAVVGDAVFAGSMGGGMVSYEDALRTNREEILSLPDDTILCPGHGPLTTVGEEKAHNPFF